MKKVLSFVGGAFWATLVITIAFLNYFSGIVAGIWLAILGHWSAIGYGILLSIMMPTAYTIIALPTMLIAPLMMYFIRKNNRLLASIFAFINVLYEKTIIIFWVFLVFRYFTAEATSASFIPLLLLGYSTTLGPLGYMASHEPQGSIGTSMGMFLAIVSYVALVIMWFTIGVNFIALIILAIIFSVFNLALAIPMIKDAENN